MGKLVDYRNVSGNPAGAGASSVAITGSDGRNMHAEYIRLEPESSLERVVPAGCDQHLFVLAGSGVLGGARLAMHPLRNGSFALIEEGQSFALRAEATCEVLSVLTPPPGTRWSVPGFKGGIQVISMHDAHVDEFPEAKKQRIYLATRATCGSERAHAMIVKYVPETVTSMHAHPDCESLFVFLEGETQLTVNGEKKTGRFGQAAFFPSGDRHDLRGGTANSHFIEFHVPCNYTTVR